MSSKPYKMPAVHVGDIVLWKHNVGSNDPAPAVVTKVGQAGIGVLMLPPDSRVGTPRDGVRHVSDPALATVLSSDTGVWDYTFSHYENADRLKDLEQAVAALLKSSK